MNDDDGIRLRVHRQARVEYPRSAGHRTVFRAGGEAALAGRTPGSCPYVTTGWGASYRNAWRTGYYTALKYQRQIVR